MNYFEKHIGDYLKDTSHLSLLEHGVYNRLFDVYYTREGGIPDEQAARLIGARTRDEKTALKDVLQEFFVLVDGAWTQARCESEIARYRDKQAKAKRSAEARWSGSRPQSDGNANASPEHVASDMRTHSEGNAPRARPQTPNPKPQSPEETAGAVSPHSPTAAGEACKAMKQASVIGINPSHPDLQRLIAAGVTTQEFADAAAEAKVKNFPYVLRMVEGRRNDAAAKGSVASKTDPDDWTRHAA